MSWNDLVARQHAMRMASQLPSPTRDIRDVVGRLIKDLDKARLDFTFCSKRSGWISHHQDLSGLPARGGGVDLSDT